MMQQSVWSQWCTDRSCRGSWTLFWDSQSVEEEQLLPHRFCGDDVMSPSQVISDMDFQESEVAHHSIDADSVCCSACCLLYSTVSFLSSIRPMVSCFQQCHVLCGCSHVEDVVVLTHTASQEDQYSFLVCAIQPKVSELHWINELQSCVFYTS